MKRKRLKPPQSGERVRLPGPDDPLTTDELEDLFRQMDKSGGPKERHMLASEMENVWRMRATIQFYAGIIAGLQELVDGLDLITVDACLPERRLVNRVAYLVDRGCRVCGCTDTEACEGGCYWVEPDLCSQCAAKAGIAEV